MNRGIPLPLVRWRGFTLQLFLLMVLPLSALLLVIVLYSQSLHHNSMRTLVGDRDLRAVRASANNLSDEIAHRASALEMISFQVSPGKTTAAMLDAAAQQNSFDGGLALFDAQGRRIVNSTRASANILDLPAVTRAHPVQIGPPGGSSILSGARLSPPIPSADGRWMILGLAQPGSEYTLVGAFSPTTMARTTLNGVANEQSAIMLISAEGELLFSSGQMNHSVPVAQHPGVADVLRGESGVNYSAPSGSDILNGHAGEHVVAFSPVPPFGWGLVLEEPWEESAGPLLSATQSAPLILVPALILALLALWFGARQVIQPLQALESRAGQLASGDFSAIRAPVGGISEIHNLQEQLVDMAGALQNAQEALHAYIGALTDGLENERRSLARELHDDTLQALIALNQHLQMTLLHTDPPQSQSLLDLQGQVAETIANLRRAIGGLRPIYLEDLGLVAALGMLAKNDGNTDPTAPSIEFNVIGQEIRLKPEAELALYRIAQEALNNALQHAHPTRVQIELAFETGLPGSAQKPVARLSICDNGQGFTLPAGPGGFAHLGHYGLLGMRERADLIGAQLKISSDIGNGAQVIVSLPE